MNEIEFRGKRKHGPEWIVGDLGHEDDAKFIFPTNKDTPLYHPDWFEVDPKTIGQYTSFSDKDGSRIYGGDTVSYAGKCYTVKMINGCWSGVMQAGSYQFLLCDIASSCKVFIGDITVKQADYVKRNRKGVPAGEAN